MADLSALTPEAARVYALALVADLFGPELEARQVAAVDCARAHGASWDEIGEAMGYGPGHRGNAYAWRKRRGSDAPPEHP